MNFNKFIGSYIIIFNSNKKISEWISYLLSLPDFNCRNWENRRRIINISNSFLPDINIEKKIDDFHADGFNLKNKYFMEKSNIGKEKKPKAMHILSDYNNKNLYKYLYSKNVNTKFIFFVPSKSDDSQDYKVLINSVRNKSNDIDIIAVCESVSDADKCIALGASHALATADLQNKLLLSKLLKSNMISFLNELFSDDKKKPEQTPSIFTCSIELGKKETKKLDVKYLYELSKKFDVEVLSLLSKQTKILPKTGNITLNKFDKFICWGFSDATIIEFKNKLTRLSLLNSN